jgi:hypothetical protein
MFAAINQGFDIQPPAERRADGASPSIACVENA